jgi:hypothetical protein
MCVMSCHQRRSLLPHLRQSFPPRQDQPFVNTDRLLAGQQSPTPAQELTSSRLPFPAPLAPSHSRGRCLFVSSPSRSQPRTRPTSFSQEKLMGTGFRTATSRVATAALVRCGPRFSAYLALIYYPLVRQVQSRTRIILVTPTLTRFGSSKSLLCFTSRVS